MFFIEGCGNQLKRPQTVFDQPCSIYEDFGATPDNSLIANKIENPCAVQSLLATAAKLPAIWAEKEYTDLFEKWAIFIEEQVKFGISYQRLQDLVIMEIAKMNKQAGMTLLVLGDGIFVFGGETDMILPVDKKLVLASIEDLRAKVKQIALML
jgi:hypothetical protein